MYELLPASSRDVYREKVSMCQPHDRNHLLHQETQCDSEKVAGCPMHFFLVGLPPPPQEREENGKRDMLRESAVLTDGRMALWKVRLCNLSSGVSLLPPSPSGKPFLV